MIGRNFIDLSSLVFFFVGYSLSGLEALFSPFIALLFTEETLPHVLNWPKPEQQNFRCTRLSVSLAQVQAIAVTCAQP